MYPYAHAHLVVTWELQERLAQAKKVATGSEDLVSVDGFRDCVELDTCQEST